MSARDHDVLDADLNRLLNEPGNSPTENGLIDVANALVARVRKLEAKVEDLETRQLMAERKRPMWRKR